MQLVAAPHTLLNSLYPRTYQAAPLQRHSLWGPMHTVSFEKCATEEPSKDQRMQVTDDPHISWQSMQLVILSWRGLRSGSTPSSRNQRQGPVRSVGWREDRRV